MKQALITGNANRLDRVYGPNEHAMLEERFATQTVSSQQIDDADLSEVEFIFGTWGLTKFTPEFMARMPKLQAVFYAAGSVKGFTTDAFWDSGVRLFSAWGANAVPVAEFTFAQVILCLKRAWPAIRHTWANHEPSIAEYHKDNVPGCFGTTVGLLSLGQIGRLVVDRLRSLDINIIAFDPFISQEEAHELGVTLRSLEEVFAESDVVSCHTPWLEQTVKMLKREHFAAMKPNSSFINTARGAVVDEDGLISVLQERPDITAMLDVTYPEPPVEGSPFYTLPNVVLTPHIAGSVANECRRMAQFMIAEYDRMSADLPVHWEINKARAATLA